MAELKFPSHICKWINTVHKYTAAHMLPKKHHTRRITPAPSLIRPSRARDNLDFSRARATEPSHARLHIDEAIANHAANAPWRCVRCAASGTFTYADKHTPVGVRTFAAQRVAADCDCLYVSRRLCEIGHNYRGNRVLIDRAHVVVFYTHTHIFYV